MHTCSRCSLICGPVLTVRLLETETCLTYETLESVLKDVRVLFGIRFDESTSPIQSKDAHRALNSNLSSRRISSNDYWYGIQVSQLTVGFFHSPSNSKFEFVSLTRGRRQVITNNTREWTVRKKRNKSVGVTEFSVTRGSNKKLACRGDGEQ